ncbi:MAG TPA: Crp/Fnr family transcriptional regulator [Pyrinomonadaceae bacterium]|jgi:CRP-like cAMP-binding protein
MSENRLLAVLPVDEQERLLPHVERVSLILGDVIYEADEPVRYVYFPTSGVVSILCTTDDGASIEAATVGMEGMAGIPVFLGVVVSPNRAIVQVAGEALRMKSEVFRDLSGQSGSLHDLLHLYTYALMNQMSLSVACNRFHNVERRLARWLLMMQDRAQVDEFQFTQELISRMIGTRRPHVSTAVGNLHNAGLIHNGRGKIDILDRDGLVKIACDCYLTAKKRFDGLFNA